jgi:hypothetical protein
MALKLDILANTTKFVTEMKKAGASTEDISDALDDMAKEGKDSGEKLERSFKELAKESEKTGDAIGRNIKAGTDKAERGMEDLKDESRSTAKEAAASFDGSAESIGEAFQEIAANALGGFGPVGEAAGLALALGIGVGITALGAMGEQSEAIKEQVSQNFRDMADNGVAAWESMEAQNQRLTEAYDEHYDEIRKIGDAIGLPFETVAAAWAGNKDAIDLVRAAQGELVADLDSDSTAMERAIASGITKPLEDVISVYDQSKEKAKQLEGQIATSQEKHRAEIQKTRTELEKFATGKYDTSATVKLGVDTTNADRDIAAFRARTLRAINTNVIVNGRQAI